jgi:hypothetical protein
MWGLRDVWMQTYGFRFLELKSSFDEMVNPKEVELSALTFQNRRIECSEIPKT